MQKLQPPRGRLFSLCCDGVSGLQAEHCCHERGYSGQLFFLQVELAKKEGTCITVIIMTNHHDVERYYYADNIETSSTNERCSHRQLHRNQYRVV